MNRIAITPPESREKSYFKKSLRNRIRKPISNFRASQRKNWLTKRLRQNELLRRSSNFASLPSAPQKRATFRSAIRKHGVFFILSTLLIILGFTASLFNAFDLSISDPSSLLIAILNVTWGQPVWVLLILLIPAIVWLFVLFIRFTYSKRLGNLTIAVAMSIASIEIMIFLREADLSTFEWLGLLSISVFTLLTYFQFRDRPTRIVIPFEIGGKTSPELNAIANLITQNLAHELQQISALLRVRQVENLKLNEEGSNAFFVTSGTDQEIFNQLEDVVNITTENIKGNPLGGLLIQILRTFSAVRVEGKVQQRSNGGIEIWSQLTESNGRTASVAQVILPEGFIGEIDDKSIRPVAHELAVNLLLKLGYVSHLGNSPETVNSLLSGLEASLNRDWWSAISFYRQAIQEEETLNNRYGVGHYHLGVALLYQGSWQSGLEHLRIAENDGPPIPEVHYMIALALLFIHWVELGQKPNLLKEIDTRLKKATELRPNFPDAYHLRGVAYYRVGRLSERAATRWYRPDESKTKYLKSFKEAEDSFRKAQRLYEKLSFEGYSQAVSLPPSVHTQSQNWREQNILMTHLLGDVLRVQEKYLEAITYYDDYITVKPSNIRNLVDVAKTYCLDERWSKAEEFLWHRVYIRDIAYWNADAAIHMGWALAGGVDGNLIDEGVSIGILGKRLKNIDRGQMKDHLRAEILLDAMQFIDYAIHQRPRYITYYRQTNWFNPFYSSIATKESKQSHDKVFFSPFNVSDPVPFQFKRMAMWTAYRIEVYGLFSDEESVKESITDVLHDEANAVRSIISGVGGWFKSTNSDEARSEDQADSESFFSSLEKWYASRHDKFSVSIPSIIRGWFKSMDLDEDNSSSQTNTEGFFSLLVNQYSSEVYSDKNDSGDQISSARLFSQLEQRYSSRDRKLIEDDREVLVCLLQALKQREKWPRTKSVDEIDQEIIKRKQSYGKFGRILDKLRSLRKRYVYFLDEIQRSKRFTGLYRLVQRLSLADEFYDLWKQADVAWAGLSTLDEAPTFGDRVCIDIYMETSLSTCKLLAESQSYERLYEVASKACGGAEQWVKWWQTYYRKSELGYFHPETDYIFNARVFRYQKATLHAWLALAKYKCNWDKLTRSRIRVIRDLPTKLKLPVELYNIPDDKEWLNNIEKDLQNARSYIFYHPLVMYVEALVKRRQGLYEQAVKIYKQIIDLIAPYDPKQQIGAEEIADYTPLFPKIDDKTDIEKHKRTYLRFMELTSGRQQFNTLIDRAKLHMEIADTYKEMGQLDLRVEHLREAIRWSPHKDQDVDNMLRLANQLNQIERYREAAAVVAVAKDTLNQLGNSQPSEVKRRLPDVLQCTIETRSGNYSASMSRAKKLARTFDFVPDTNPKFKSPDKDVENDQNNHVGFLNREVGKIRELLGGEVASEKEDTTFQTMRSLLLDEDQASEFKNSEKTLSSILVYINQLDEFIYDQDIDSSLSIRLFRVFTGIQTDDQTEESEKEVTIPQEISTKFDRATREACYTLNEQMRVKILKKYISSYSNETTDTPFDYSRFNLASHLALFVSNEASKSLSQLAELCNVLAYDRAQTGLHLQHGFYDSNCAVTITAYLMSLADKNEDARSSLSKKMAQFCDTFAWVRFRHTAKVDHPAYAVNPDLVNQIEENSHNIFEIFRNNFDSTVKLDTTQQHPYFLNYLTIAEKYLKRGIRYDQERSILYYHLSRLYLKKIEMLWQMYADFMYEENLTAESRQAIAYIDAYLIQVLQYYRLAKRYDRYGRLRSQLGWLHNISTYYRKAWENRKYKGIAGNKDVSLGNSAAILSQD